MNLNDVNIMDWHANSPDINRKNIWTYIQDKRFDIKDQIRSPHETWERIHQRGSKIPLSYIQVYI